MAAPCRKLLRTAIDGLYRLSVCSRAPLVTNVSCLGSQQCAVHCMRYPLLSSTTAEPQKKAADSKTAEEEEEDFRPEYIPKRKAKNPMKIIGYAWMIGLPTGVILFILAKKQVDKNRLKQLKIRQRMKRANEGQYKSERYNPATEMD